MKITTTGGERPAFGFCMWGASNSGTNAAQRYLFPEFSDTSVTSNVVQWTVPVAFTAVAMEPV